MTLRIAYAGIIQIIAQSLTLITGLIFVAIVTRNITVEEFGLWQTLGSFVGVLLLPLAPLNYWTLRYSARGDEVGKTSKPVMVKRGFSATYEDWLLAAEYVMAGGNKSVILCERGIRTFETSTRNTMDLIRSMCPFSQALTFKNIQYATGRSLEECLITDFRLALRLMDRDDYFEGARAILIDKDRRPYWNPKTIEAVDLKQIDDCFTPLDNEDLAFDR